LACSPAVADLVDSATDFVATPSRQLITAASCGLAR
jgi:hypothetical protein